MKDFNFNRGLSDNIKTELENAQSTIDHATRMAKEEFPDNSRGQELAKKEAFGDLTKKERIELYKLLDAKKKKEGKRDKPEDLDKN